MDLTRNRRKNVVLTPGSRFCSQEIENKSHLLRAFNLVPARECRKKPLGFAWFWPDPPDPHGHGSKSWVRSGDCGGPSSTKWKSCGIACCFARRGKLRKCVCVCGKEVCQKPSTNPRYSAGCHNLRCLSCCWAAVINP